MPDSTSELTAAPAHTEILDASWNVFLKVEVNPEIDSGFYTFPSMAAISALVITCPRVY